MKLITDEKLAKLIEDAFDKGYDFGNSTLAYYYTNREKLVAKLVAESLQKASEQ